MASPTPTNTNAATATARPAAGRPQLSHPSPYPIYHQQVQQQQHYLNTTSNNNSIRSQTLIPTSNTPQPPPGGILYPVASSGRGFIPPPVPPPPTTRPSSSDYSRSYNSSASPSLALSNYRAASPSPLPHPYYPPPAHRLHPSLPNNPHYLQSPPPPPASAPIIGVPVVPQLKVASSPAPVSDSNGYKRTRDTPDDPVLLIRGRKVVVQEGASIYALCRSWLRNGLPEKRQAEESVENLSAQDLLKRHVKHAKKVRARLKKERLNRIERYKTRLALLLPPQVEQLRNDNAAGH